MLLRKYLVVSGLALFVFATSGKPAHAQTLYEADFGTGANSSVFAFTTSGVKSTLASGLSYAEGIALDSSGNVYVGDTGIDKITPGGVKSNFVSTLNLPYGLAFDSAGNLYEADINTGHIYKFTSAGVQSTFASGLSDPWGLAFDSSGNLYEADANSGHIYKFTPGGTQSTFASGLNDPQALAFASNGDLYDADANGTIYKFTSSGTQSVFASLSNGDADGLAFDGDGNLYVSNVPNANVGKSEIDKFTPSGTESVFASGLTQAGGLVFAPAAATPEPGALAMLAAVLLSGLAFYKKRR